jgi:hypothetical protein
MHGLRTPPCLHTPALDVADDRRCGFVNPQRLRCGDRLPDVRVAGGWIPPIHAALARRKQPPAPGACWDQGARVCGEDPRQLEAHLCCRTRAQALVRKDDFTASPGELLDEDPLIGRAAGQAIRGRDQHDLDRPVGCQIASTIQRGPSEAGATDPVSDQDTAGGDVLPMRGGGLIEQVDLAGDGCFARLLLGGDSSIQGGTLQEPLARRVGLISHAGAECGAGDGCGRRCVGRQRSMAGPTRSLPSRQGTLPQRMSSARGGPSEAIGLPPGRVLSIGHRLGCSLAERRPVYTRTCGSWVGAAMAPEGADHVKGQACLGCKRNSIFLEPQVDRVWAP